MVTKTRWFEPREIGNRLGITLYAGWTTLSTGGTGVQEAFPFPTGYDTIFAEHKAVGSEDRRVFNSEAAHIVAIRIIGEKATA